MTEVKSDQPEVNPFDAMLKELRQKEKYHMETARGYAFDYVMKSSGYDEQSNELRQSAMEYASRAKTMSEVIQIVIKHRAAIESMYA